MSELDGDAVREVLKEEFRGVLIDFWSPWCSPCRSLRPHLHKMAEEREARWRFVAVNTEAHPNVAEEFGVQSLPTIVLFKRGEELFRFAGAALVSSIDEKLEEYA
ncbi:MAG: thioredoxin domain-containing protein [Myxococcota bacterium]